MNLEVKIEIRSIVKKKLNSPTDDNTHSFVVFVQGVNGNQIEHFVKQVVFYLPFHSSNPKQVRRKPPYIISESTHTSFRLPIDLFLHTSGNCNKVRYSYYLFVPDKPVENAVCVKTLTFLNSPQDFKERLLLGGAEVVNDQKKVGTQFKCKSEPVEIIENQVVVNDQNKVGTQFKCKSEPVEIIENQEVVNDQKKVRTQVKYESEPVEIIENQKVADSDDAPKTNVEHLICKTEPTEDVNIEEETHNQLPNSCVENNDVSEQHSSLRIESIYSFEELLKQNRILKEENEALNKKFNHQESVIATYVEKLPVLQNNSSTLSTELNQLKQRSEANEVVISTLKSSVEIIKSEILQHKNKCNEIEETIARPEIPAISAQNK